MLPESRLFNFIDSKNGFTISFFEGQKVIHDLAIIHNLKNKGFHFFRDSILSTLPLINFLKPQENMGLFIDSEEPYFRLKLEMNSAGHMRTLLLPESFDELPTRYSGQVRQSKMFPHSPTPYTSVMKVDNHTTNEVVNMILKDSYQVNSKVILSEDSDQAVLFSRLPQKNVNKEEVIERQSLHDYWQDIEPKITNLFKEASTDYDKIQRVVEELGFEFIGSKEISFKCNCSRERMLTGVAGLTGSHTIDDIFDGKESLEAKCDYCKTNYLITRDEIINLIQLKH
ncbi:Hsp33 family molecular chaperone HslO [Bacteriovorax sp. DB6_IX]|uniref:Hsp33 family molecular chaperone HslO n=2 Tax=Bacteriovorax sp. DB6_IX TaxID=1353530 RepID=UPI00038A543F|nr:Hsp33 family molecular chaperone HslO [Bacteriovorax sp. DB6_IX]EQC51724.1 chaperonin HslO [Bacteriovorax sp. DB6_IX]